MSTRSCAARGCFSRPALEQTDKARARGLFCPRPTRTALTYEQPPNAVTSSRQPPTRTAITASVFGVLHVVGVGFGVSSVSSRLDAEATLRFLSSRVSHLFLGATRTAVFLGIGLESGSTSGYGVLSASVIDAKASVDRVVRVERAVPAARREQCSVDGQPKSGESDRKIALFTPGPKRLVRKHDSGDYAAR